LVKRNRRPGFSVVALILIAFLCGNWILNLNRDQTKLDYSDVVQLLEQEKVTKVDFPDAHTIVLTLREPVDGQETLRYGTYSGDGLSAEGYSCTVTLKAWRLSDPASAAGFSETRKPEDTVRLRRDGGGSFWKTPPELAGTEKLAGFTEAILGWYGFGAGEGTRGAGVKALQQALIDRGFLADRADGDFGPKTGAAVMRLQEAYGLPMTGLVDGRTLLAAYYDAETVAALP